MPLIFTLLLAGSLFSFEMKDSRIYPGTERTISVWVPDEYNAEEPACLMVRFDRLGNLPEVAAALIANGEIPVCIAIGIEPGKIYSEDHKKVIRYNRSNEFDRTDGRMAAFLETEVLPELRRQRTPDGRPILISEKASDRATIGASSGGIAAFNAAWERPDLFSRVYSMIGTFVPFRYGDQFPGIIRKTEPKRLRIFLQDNKDDTWNPIFGSWYDANVLMLKALQFAGYELDFQWDEGRHSAKNGNDIMAYVLKWLWAGWPEAVGKAVSGNKSLAGIVSPDSEWKLEQENIAPGTILKSDGDGGVKLLPAKKKRYFNPLEATYPGGAHCAVAKEGSCWIDNYIIREGKKKWGQEFYCLHSPARQIAFDEKGYLYCATDKGIQICDHNGRVRVILGIDAGPVESIAFAGRKLYAISGGRLWSRELLVAGATPSSPEPKREGQG